jgi:DNA-binding NtrC family response regulator
MKNILVLEDDPILLLAYRELLSAYDYTLILCSDVASAAEYLSQNHIDLIISDYHLPDATSMVLLKLIQVWKKDIPIIIITSNNLIREEQPEIIALVKSLMFKPIHKNEFYHNINTLLSA